LIENYNKKEWFTLLLIMQIFYILLML
jgi:hypothetical protein